MDVTSELPQAIGDFLRDALVAKKRKLTGEVGTDGAEFVESYAALINEIRVRQPQAKILLFAPLPRGESLEAWRQRAQTNAAVFAPRGEAEAARGKQTAGIIVATHQRRSITIQPSVSSLSRMTTVLNPCSWANTPKCSS